MSQVATHAASFVSLPSGPMIHAFSRLSTVVYYGPLLSQEAWITVSIEDSSDGLILNRCT